jgi:hypothetical protein
MNDLREKVALLPCPFCGIFPTRGFLRNDGLSPNDAGTVVHHGDDECPGEGFHTLEAWNRRALLAETPPSDQGLRDAAEELLTVADLRGDSDLPHPADDEKHWTARMQTAWDDLRAALASKKGGE